MMKMRNRAGIDSYNPAAQQARKLYLTALN
jgi:hypothetical protein